jgi:hypothetical protein
MPGQTVVPELTDEEVARRLLAAQADEREKRLVHCDSETELRELFGTLPDKT